MDKYRKILAAILLLGGLSIVLSSGCIREGQGSGCDLFLDIHFYSKTECQGEREYPEEIENMALLLFDEHGVLVDYRINLEVNLDSSYTERMSIKEIGRYTIDTWAGVIDPAFFIVDPQIGTTTRDNLFIKLRRTQGQFFPIDGIKVYFGESIPLDATSENYSSAVNTSINLREITNRLTVTVEGLDGELENYEINVESNDGSMTLEGTLAPDDVMRYDYTERSAIGLLMADFTILKLEQGYVNDLVIRNTKTEVELFRGDLLETLLLKNPTINMACTNDFRLRFKADEIGSDGTYMITGIWVNDWQVHSYDLDN